jgi:hypothetical protein
MEGEWCVCVCESMNIACVVIYLLFSRQAKKRRVSHTTLESFRFLLPLSIKTPNIPHLQLHPTATATFSTNYTLSSIPPPPNPSSPTIHQPSIHHRHSTRDPPHRQSRAERNMTNPALARFGLRRMRRLTAASGDCVR